MLGALLFGFLLGMKHAVEADHVAAVAALAIRSTSIADRMKLASVWGLGHAGTIFLLGGTVLALGLSLPEHVTRTFETLVGLMLIVLGIDVLRRLRRQGVHFHAHQHGPGRRHFHAHVHARGQAHAAHAASGQHTHEHPAGLLPRALLVGSMHGLAGSAALVVLSMELTRSATQALLYLGTFGLGSILGMAALSLAISLPIRLSAERLGPAWRMIQGALGVMTIGLGCWMALSRT